MIKKNFKWILIAFIIVIVLIGVFAISLFSNFQNGEGLNDLFLQLKDDYKIEDVLNNQADETDRLNMQTLIKDASNNLVFKNNQINQDLTSVNLTNDVVLLCEEYVMLVNAFCNLDEIEFLQMQSYFDNDTNAFKQEYYYMFSTKSIKELNIFSITDKLYFNVECEKYANNFKPKSSNLISVNGIDKENAESEISSLFFNDSNISIIDEYNKDIETFFNCKIKLSDDKIILFAC